MSGNDYGSDVTIGRYDAFNGLVLKGRRESGNFQPQSILQSGIYIPGNGKALVKLNGAQGKYLLAASQHNDVMKIFELKRNVRSIKLQPLDSYAIIKYKNGKMTRQEFYYGESFLSQSGKVYEHRRYHGFRYDNRRIWAHKKGSVTICNLFRSMIKVSISS